MNHVSESPLKEHYHTYFIILRVGLRADVTVFTTSLQQNIKSQLVFSDTVWSKAATLEGKEIQVVRLLPQRKARYVAVVRKDYINIAEVQVYQPPKYTGR